VSKKAYIGPSEAQGNAERLAHRSSTHADQHAASIEIKWRRASSDMTTRELVEYLVTEYADEVPSAIHEGPDHIDAGGVPAMRSNFLAYITSGDGAVIESLPRKDAEGVEYDRPILVGELRKPLQNAVGGMLRGKGKHAWWGRIVGRILFGSEHPKLAAMAEGAHEYQADEAAWAALSECRRRLTPMRMDLVPRERVA
jgi:hypothetical protein